MTAWWGARSWPAFPRGRPASTWVSAAASRARPRRRSTPCCWPWPAPGKRVVRLKGGDPLVFGRGGEEALHLARHGIAAELVPGITAALGCAASTFIPLTHRGLARSLTLVTGHLMDERDYQGWQGLTRAGHTLVFYMGLERAAQIRQGLLAAGASLDVPVALVVAGCSARQQVHETTLDGLAQAALALLGQSPVLIIVGEVVRLRAELQGLLTEALDRVA